jgi:hypothetical protein
LVSAGGLLPSFNARRFFDMVQSSGERRRLVLFSGHGEAFFVICVISRVLIEKGFVSYSLMKYKILF